ncbi:acetylxylan esterase [Georgenia faecalis]|uniref:Acetylxylan esterase n=1 Tax=Georgenia faecalis TaxID=2483799 RepID=A0ABV9D883_9MICO|nr:alpha/beta fold hydrolase [Georgenia faecalis]
MAQFDLPLSRLVSYRPPREEPDDFDEFWRATLAEQDERHPLEVSFDPVDTGLVQVLTEDVTFTGFGGQPVKGWFHRPAGAQPGLGVVVQFVGYNGGRGLAHETTLLAQAGYAVLVMDNRGQGGGKHLVGDTGDSFVTGPAVTGFITQGIDSPETYYYRRHFTDAVRAVRAARQHRLVDADRVLTCGASQGGALSLAAAALGGPVRGAVVDVPFLTHVRHATEITDAAPYSELVRYLGARRDRVEAAFRTLSYFDGVNLAARVGARGLFSVGLLDTICPPSAVYAAYNHYAGPKEMVVYPYNGHEHGQAYQDVEHLRFVREVLGAP